MVPTPGEGGLHGASSFAQLGLEWNEVQCFVFLGEREQLGMIARGA